MMTTTTYGSTSTIYIGQIDLSIYDAVQKQLVWRGTVSKNNSGEKRLKRKRYEKELRRLQAELCKLQDWVKYMGLRIMVVFEGRDAAGKGGTIRAITERVSPRVFRLVALPAPSNRENLKCTFNVI